MTTQCYGCDPVMQKNNAHARLCDACVLKQEQAYETYYAPTTKWVLVPVEVKYHAPTDTVYSFTSPTIEDVETALMREGKK